MRANPNLEVKDGVLINPETGMPKWFHGSWIGKVSSFRRSSPRSHAYGATYFTSNDFLAEDFASGERAWLDFDEDPPRLKRTGYVHAVRIHDVPLLDPDKIFTDKAELLLSPEGVRFVEELSDRDASSSDIESFLRTFSRSHYSAFSKGYTFWDILLESMEALGYRGWFERESKDRTHTNIGLLYPNKDAQIVGGYPVKRTRRF